MQKELETIREKYPLIKTGEETFGAFLEPLSPDQCTMLLETINDLQKIFHAIRPSIEKRPLFVIPLHGAIDHSRKLTLQLASYRDVCRNPAMKYLQQRQNIAAFLSQLAKTMEDVLTVAEQPPTVSSASTAERRQRAGFFVVSNAEEEG
jgi:hypothetical protein